MNCNLKKNLPVCYYYENKLSFGPQNGQMKYCKGYNDECFTLVTEDETIVKDCLHEYAERNNLPINFLSDKYNRSSYSVCSSRLCNDQEVKPTNCITCDSRHHLGCNGPFTTTWRRYFFHKCPLELNPSGCYHFNANYTQRGCMADLIDEKRVLCEQDSDLCKKCVGIECNGKTEFQTCLTDNQLTPSLSQSKVCKRYLDECFTRLNRTAGGGVLRGCTSDLTNLSADEFDFDVDCQNVYCRTCSDRQNCNDVTIEPEFCVDCHDMAECVESPNFDMIKQCPLSLNRMGCYLHKDTLFHVDRGCVSELDAELQSECEQGDRCKICMGNSCNLKADFQECNACDSGSGSDADKERCLTRPWHSTFVTCPNYDDECYTFIKNDTVMRNCIGDTNILNAEECDRNAGYCERCSGKGYCNDVVLTQETCISCDSSVDPTCATNTTFESIETCPLWIHPQTCYHFISETTGVHKRGKFIGSVSIEFISMFAFLYSTNRLYFDAFWTNENALPSEW